LTRITEVFGFSPMLAYVVAAPLTVLAGIGLKFLASPNYNVRVLSSLVLSLFVALWWLLLWGGTRDHMVGEFQKCYTIDEDGVNYFDAMQLDPRNGIMCKWVGAEDIVPLRKLDQRLRSGIPMRRITFLVPEEVEFFYPNTSSLVPKVWYFKSQDGWLEFYDMPGTHPAYGAPLKPMTPNVAKSWMDKFKASLVPKPTTKPNDKKPKQVNSGTNKRYVSQDGCLREGNGKVVMGFSDRCDAKSRK
jgi:hypothetical protein